MFVTYATSLNNAISLCQNNPETRQILTQFVLENQPAGFDKGDTPIRFVQHLLTLPIRHLLFLLHHLHSLTDATTPTLTSSNSNSNSVSNSNVTGRHDKVSKAYRLIKAVVYECVCILYPSSLTLVRLRLNAISSLPATRIHFTVPCIREDGQSGLLAAIDLNLIFFAPPTQPTSAPVRLSDPLRPQLRLQLASCTYGLPATPNPRRRSFEFSKMDAVLSIVDLVTDTEYSLQCTDEQERDWVLNQLSNLAAMTTPLQLALSPPTLHSHSNSRIHNEGAVWSHVLCTEHWIESISEPSIATEVDSSADAMGFQNNTSNGKLSSAVGGPSGKSNGGLSDKFRANDMSNNNKQQQVDESQIGVPEGVVQLRSVFVSRALQELYDEHGVTFREELTNFKLAPLPDRGSDAHSDCSDETSSTNTSFSNQDPSTPNSSRRRLSSTSSSGINSTGAMPAPRKVNLSVFGDPSLIQTTTQIPESRKVVLTAIEAVSLCDVLVGGVQRVVAPDETRVVKYAVQVTLPLNNREHSDRHVLRVTTLRRYSRFHALHKDLKKYLGSAYNLSCPPKQLNSSSRSCVKQRSTALGAFLKGVSGLFSHVTMKSGNSRINNAALCVLEFLGLESAEEINANSLASGAKPIAVYMPDGTIENEVYGLTCAQVRDEITRRRGLGNASWKYAIFATMKMAQAHPESPRSSTARFSNPTETVVMFEKPRLLDDTYLIRDISVYLSTSEHVRSSNLIFWCLKIVPSPSYGSALVEHRQSPSGLISVGTASSLADPHTTETNLKADLLFEFAQVTHFVTTNTIQVSNSAAVRLAAYHLWWLALNDSRTFTTPSTVANSGGEFSPTQFPQAPSPVPGTLSNCVAPNLPISSEFAYHHLPTVVPREFGHSRRLIEILEAIQTACKTAQVVTGLEGKDDAMSWSIVESSRRDRHKTECVCSYLQIVFTDRPFEYGCVIFDEVILCSVNDMTRIPSLLSQKFSQAPEDSSTTTSVATDVLSSTKSDRGASRSEVGLAMGTANMTLQLPISTLVGVRVDNVFVIDRTSRHLLQSFPLRGFQDCVCSLDSVTLIGRTHTVAFATQDALNLGACIDRFLDIRRNFNV
eukprot:c20355_g3_i2.p1 GENE.c20355_g3_i2~~c20355_g3_i2.p1  ORF type:complete len:1099 (+),score=254.52 c20355_g3_i2:1083-4379(+)